MTMKITESDIGIIFLTNCGMIVQMMEYNDEDLSAWPIICNVLSGIEKSSFYDDGDGIGWAWNTQGQFDVSNERFDTDIKQIITKEENPEYFL